MQSKRSTYYLLLLVGLSLLSTLLTAWFGDFHLVDSEEYLATARQWQDGAVSDPSEWTKRPPLYPAVLWLLGTGGTLLLQNGLAILLFYSLFQTLKAEGLSHKRYLLLIGLTATSWNVFLYADKIMAEVLAMAVLWMLWQAYRRNQKWFFWIGAAALPFIKPVFLFLPVVLIGFVLFQKSRRSWAFGLIASLLLSAGYMAYNHHRTGSAEFSSIQHINALHYNKYQFDVERYGMEYAAQQNDSIKRLGERLTYPERVDLYNEAFAAEVKADPLGYLWFHTKGAIRGAIDPGRFDLQFLLPTTIEEGFAHRADGSLWGYLKSLNLITVLILLPLAAINGLRILLALRGAWQNRRQSDMLLLFILVAYVIGITGPIHASRFMVPVIPFILYAAVLGLPHRISKR